MLAQQTTQPITIENVTGRFQAATVDAADLLVAVIAIAAGFALGAVTRTVVRRGLLSIRGVTPPTATTVARLTGYLVVVFGLVVALSAVGLDFGPVITILVMVALVAVLIGRPMLADLGAGVVLQSRRPVAIGDIVRAAGAEGIVEDIDGRVVQLRTYDGWLVRVRNSDVMTNPIVKLAEPDRVRVDFAIGLHYDTDLDQAVEVASRALEATPGVLDTPAPQALLEEFADSTIALRCWIWAAPARRWQVKDAALRATKRALDHSSIVIAYPQRVVHAS